MNETSHLPPSVHQLDDGDDQLGPEEKDPPQSPSGIWAKGKVMKQKVKETASKPKAAVKLHYYYFVDAGDSIAAPFIQALIDEV